MTTLQLRIDDELRDEAASVCRSMGLDVSTAVRMFLTRLVDDRKFPFLPESADPFFTPRHVAMLEERIHDIQEGRNCAEHDLVEV